ncbi:MAG: sialate O-acetylesterase [Planctomycetota bacterium]
MSRHLSAVSLSVLLASVTVASWTTAAPADVSLNNMFGDHMVLQRGIANRVWGRAAPGEKVTVSIAGQVKSTAAGADGRWEVKLKPIAEYGGPHTLTVKGTNAVTFKDVLVGEVWVCSGQSNMQWAVNESNDPDLEKAAANFPQIRLISVPQVGTQEPQDNFQHAWQVCSPQTVGEFSAVGYLFGRQLHQTLGVPVGLIDNARSGSAAEAWVKREKIAAHPTLKAIHDRWKRLEAEQPNDGQMTGNQRPGNIHAGVLTPSIGYGIRGVIWYQGESNAGRAHRYRTLFPLMIQSWRDEWNLADNKEFPFYWVQLADYKAEQATPAESDWAELREAQTMTLDALPNTGQAVIIDIGEGKDIHPKNKQDVAKRLARWALAEAYKQPGIACKSPRYAGLSRDGVKAVLSFNDVIGGWRPFDVAEPRGFTIAGVDRKFVPARAAIRQDGTIEVWGDGVTEPVAVRYAWADNPDCNMYSGAGLPLTPFRTDDFSGVTVGKE